ncbi:MAG: hypothetical protein ACOC36_00250 [Fibrobacterota bacterium]
MFRNCCSVFSWSMLRGSGLIFSVILSALLMSCAGSSLLRREKLSEAVASNDFPSAVSTIKKHKKLYKNAEFLYHMDLGVLYHYAGLFDSSNTHLFQAAQIHEELYARSVTNEAAAVLTNDNVRPYRSRPYELVQLHQFIALNFLAQGKYQEALVETRRVQLMFNEWERTGGEKGKYHSDGMFHLVSSLAYEAVGETDNSLISLFKSVKAFKAGPVPLSPEVKHYAYERLVAGGRESDTSLLNIRGSAKSRWNIGQGTSEIVLIGYAGKGPALQEKFWSGTYVKDGILLLSTRGPDGRVITERMSAPSLPASEYAKAARGQKTRSGTTFHVKVALPEVQTFPSNAAYFTAQTNSFSESARSVVVNDINLQARKALKDAWGTTITRTVVRVVLRTIAAQKAKARIRTESPLANLLLNLGTDVLADQLEKADTRSCFLLPQKIHMVRIPVNPGVHTVRVNVYDRSGRQMGMREYKDVRVKKGEKKFIFHHSLK